MNPGSKRSLRMTAMKSASQFHENSKGNKRDIQKTYTCIMLPPPGKMNPLTPLTHFDAF